MGVERHLNRIVEEEGGVHLTLLDPDAQSPGEAGEIAGMVEEGGSDAVMVGGSTGAGGRILDETILAIKDNTTLPVILFPGGVGGVSRHADAIFFMSLLNSRDVNYITTSQALGAPLVASYGIEPISMAYLLVEPGGMAGWIGDARLLPRSRPKLAAAYALAGKYLGMHYTYLEAGSGAGEPVPPELIRAVKEVLGENKLIVGGGIRDAKAARAAIDAGADMIVTGTLVETSGKEDIQAKIQEIVRAVKKKKK